MKIKKKIYQNILFILIFNIACQKSENQNFDVDISNIEYNAIIENFDQDFYNINTKNIKDELKKLEDKYPGFLESFITNIVLVGKNLTPFSPEFYDEIIKFINHQELKNEWENSKKKFERYDELNIEITDMVKRMKYFYPDYTPPRFLTFFSAFNYSVITIDTLFLGISLERYLGENYPVYLNIGIDEYLRKQMEREFLMVNVATAILNLKFNNDKPLENMISSILHRGKILYFLKYLLPHLEERHLLSYDQESYAYCFRNEENLWGYLVESNLIYNTNPNVYLKYLEDSPYIKGLPRQLPGKSFNWLGLKIIESYMRNNSKVTVNKLMENENYTEILKRSKYKPKNYE